MIRIVTDSASMLPDSLRRRFGIAVVPITITIDGREHREGVDLTAADFYARLAEGAAVTTAAPAPGAFADVYRAAADAGASAVLSIHTGADYSATMASATVAAGLSDVPVTVVDTGVSSFPLALCVWSAADRLAEGGSIEAAAEAAQLTGAHTGSLFVVGVPEVARRGGRFVAVRGELTPTNVLELVEGGIFDLGRADDIETVIDIMVDRTVALAESRPLRIGVGHAAGDDVAALLVERLDGRVGVRDLTTYQVGPSVGAHTGPGTFGVVYTPVD